MARTDRGDVGPSPVASSSSVPELRGAVRPYRSIVADLDATTERAARLRTEVSIQRARIVALALATGITISLRGFTADPRWLIVTVLVVNVVAVDLALRHAPPRRRVELVGWGSFAGDTLAIGIALWVISTNPADPIWSITGLLAIEAASRWRTRGALLGGLLAASLAGWWAVIAYAAEDRPLSVESLVFRGSIIIVLALPVGLLIDQLRREQERTRQLTDLSTELIIVVDEDAEVLAVNPAATLLLQAVPEQLVGRSWRELLPGAPSLAELELLADDPDTPPPLYELTAPDGTTSWLELLLHRGGQRATELLYVIGRDVTSRVREERHLRASEQRFRALFEHNNDAVLSLDPHGTILHANPGAAQLLGIDAAQLVGEQLLEQIPLADRGSAAELLAAVRSGRRLDEEVVVRVGYQRQRDISLALLPTVIDGAISGLFAIARDVTDERIREEELRFQAHHDELTGLRNRVSFQHHLDAMLRRGGGVGLLFLDLDGLKHINDTYGHAAGDRALVAAATRLRTLTRSEDDAYRFAGDEFCVLIDTDDQADLEQLRDRISRLLAEPITIDGELVATGASVGAALSRPDDDASSLLARADAEMYAVKTLHRQHGRPR